MRCPTSIFQTLAPLAVCRWIARRWRGLWLLALSLMVVSSGCKHSPAHTGPTGAAAKPKTAVSKLRVTAAAARLPALPPASPTPPTVKPARVASGERVGVVRVIGAGQRFVLVQTPSAFGGRSLPDGQTLLCQGAGTATLRVSHERRPPFIAADVVVGEPHVGDDVYLATESHRAAAPAPPAPVASPAAGPAVSTSPSLFPSKSD